MEEHITNTTLYCLEKLSNLGTAHLDKEYYYSSISLCVIDCVFSIGVKYEGVKNTINRVCGLLDLEQKSKRKGKIPLIEEQISTSDFMKFFHNKSPLILAEEIFNNRQRTSVNNGILKSEAVVKFLSVLKDFGVEYYQDLKKITDNDSFELCIRNIPGQKSGISLKYFYMLCGNDTLIKPDRMIKRFLQDATGEKFSLVQCEILLVSVSEALNKKGYKITPKLLDRLIWNYQRGL
jgi:hypothetical protein